MLAKTIFALLFFAIVTTTQAQSNDSAANMKHVSELSRQWRICLNQAAATYANNSCRSHSELTEAAFGKCSPQERAVIDAIDASGASNGRAIIDKSRPQYEEIISSQILDRQIARNCEQSQR